MSTFARVRRTVPLVVATALAVTVTGAGALGGTPAAGAAPALTALPWAATGPGVYIVTLDTPPRPRSGAHTRRITADQDRVLAAVGDPEVVYRLTAALNGFVARLSSDQVRQLRSTEGVALVERSTTQRTASVDSPRFLHVDRAWAAAGGPDDAGRGVVVGVVDTGIWPENPSFSALPGRGRPAALRDACEAGDQWEPSVCNSKVVAARYFVEAFGEENLASSEYLSPRDGTGHGSHTAAVAAGNAAVRVRVEGQDFGTASGMAPAAQLAVYKACWTAPDPTDDGCQTADAVAALDSAVSDGVDVISYAVSGPPGATSDSVERAFLNASAAGVFVSAAAGNDGPAAGSVSHASPWVTTVGAGTHRTLEGALVLGGDVRLVGAMVSETSVPRTGIVLAEDAVAPGAQTADARRCEQGSLSASRVQDRIVVCDRGAIARVDKSATVADAGGAGMVLVNVRPDSVSADFHSVPTVHVDAAVGSLVKRFVRETENPRASLDPSASAGTPTPQVAAFSSRGDARDELVKPDLVAPGVSVLSAVAPPSNFDRLWDLASGSSTAAAHVAGIAAFVRGERPDWSPAAVRSALATTAVDLDGAPGPLAGGAGQVDATNVLDPGLAFVAATPSYRAFLGGTLEAGRLNLPAIAVGELTGTARVVRRVTNVSNRSETFTPRVTGLAGVSTTVRPRTLTLAPGETRRVSVDLSVDTAPLDTPARGHIVWTGPRHRARIPVVVLPRAVAAPDEVTGTSEEGSVPVTAVAGRDGSLEVELAGFSGARPVGLTLEPGGFDPASPADDLDTASFDVDVPRGTEVLRFELDGRSSDDIDLYLYRGDELVAGSTGDGADEVLTQVRPEPGDYTLFVQSASAGNHATTTAQLYTWVLHEDDVSNVVAPEEVAVSSGEEFAVDLSWDDLDPTSRWFGSVRFAGTDERTFVTID